MQPAHVSRGRFRYHDFHSHDTHVLGQVFSYSDEVVDDVAHLEDVAFSCDEEDVAFAYLHGFFSHR